MTMSSSKPETIAGKWKLGDKLATGAFGKVYRGLEMETGRPVAIKVSQHDAGDGALDTEDEVYTGLRNTPTDIVGIPNLYFSGKHKSHRVLVMDLLGATLELVVKKATGGTFSIKTVLMAGIQLLRRLQLLHHKGFIHRDVKPGNMLIGRRDQDRVYLIDFGVSQRYRDYETREPIKRGEAPSIVGSIPFMSINAHTGANQHRRDDLEALGYSLVYLFKGRLPWQDLKVCRLPWQKPGTKADLRIASKIGAIKAKTKVESLCEGMPEAMIEFFRYVRGLRPEKRPDYAKLRGLLRRGLEESDETEDRVFDWLDPEKSKAEKSRKSTEDKEDEVNRQSQDWERGF